ncbi:hypothetical protein LNTAR_06974 [Lentisphaera araneosa HTCC2155]|uniref:EF-hand domain-containing protein n=1 Tax=Lentisphaera araneosa HTCC2155 TaxID=313628 RepID=A6DMT0_9BACT|nr:EF-hand domain-containing protein [Lentisphaera araneosa]EDM26966.1 hypothetical protein LNTAR_06974 [Lentisphaera araneosa HTCC2155]
MTTFKKRFIKIMIVSLLCLNSFQLYAKSVKGPKSSLIIGVVQKVDGNKIEVLSRDNYLRKLTIDENSKIKFLSFENTEKVIKANYGITVSVKDEVIQSASLTLPATSKIVEPTHEMLKMTPAELFKVTDLDGNGQVSYAEIAQVLEQSPKHGPKKFNKSDRDKSGTLNQKEFAAVLTRMEWWNLSRKTPEEMFKPADKDGNGLLSKAEFALFLGKNAHLNTFFKRADKDQSGSVDLKEAGIYIDQEIFPSKKAKNIRKAKIQKASGQ